MQTINLDVSNRGVIPVVCAKQGDVGRKFKVVLTNLGSPYNPVEGSLFSVWYGGTSGVGNYTDIENHSAFSVSGNEVTVELITQMLKNPGEGLLCLVLNGTNGEQIGFWNIPYICEQVPGAGSEAAEQYFTAFSEAVANIKDGISATHSWSGTTLTITSASGSSSADLKGADGKSAYKYAQDGGFEGTEEEFAEKMASSSGSTYPSVLDYGAKGDGSTDDTVAFQTALAENRVVFVPGGTYKLSGELLIRGNCELELCQDTVLDFTQTSGNCVSMEMSASIRGHHALIKVPYTFAGNVINVTTALNQDVTAIPPWNRWDPQWKAGRYITDLNITKHDPKGFCYANQPGDCKGTAIYISADRSGTSANRSTFIWGLDFSGIRIAGAFSYGIRAVNYNEAWNHEMRIAAFITCCEIGVSLEDCNNAYISAAIEPRYAEDNSGKITGVYAKHGIQLVRSTNADLTGSRVWDWNATGTLWTDGGQYQHIGMYGDCHGAILNSFEYYIGGTDIRKLIYTDTASNLEKLTILQEPITRWFKPKNNKPYFFDGDTEKELTYKEDFDNCFVVGKTPTFTDVLAKAIDTDGSIYNGIGYSRSGGCINGSGAVNSAQTVYGHTGFIAVKASSTVRVEGMKLTDDGDTRITMYDADFKLLAAHNAGNIIPGTSYWFPNYAETENGFSFQILAGYTPCAYIRLSVLTRNIATAPLIAINEEIGYTMEGYLADGIKVKGENVVGNPALTSPNGTKYILCVADDGTISAQTVT